MSGYFRALCGNAELLLSELPWYIKKPVVAISKGQEKHWLIERTKLIDQQAAEFKKPKGAAHQAVPTVPIVKRKPFNQGEAKLNELTAYLYLLESYSKEYYLVGGHIPGDLAPVMEWTPEEVAKWNAEYKKSEKGRAGLGYFNRQSMSDYLKSEESPQQKLFNEVKAEYDKAKAGSSAIESFEKKVDAVLSACFQKLKSLEPSLKEEKIMHLLLKVSIKTKKEATRKLTTVKCLEDLIKKIIETDELDYKLKKMTALVDIVGTARKVISDKHQGGKLAKVVGVRASGTVAGLFGDHGGLTVCSSRTSNTMKALEEIQALLVTVAPAMPLSIKINCSAHAVKSGDEELDMEQTAFQPFNGASPF